MSNVVLKGISLILPIFVVLGVLSYEFAMLHTGTPFAIEVDGYDPVDLLRGHYIRYTFDTDDVVVLENYFEEDGGWTERDGYIVVTDNNRDGVYDTLAEFTIDKPKGAYLLATCRYYSEDRYRVSIPGTQTRYYISEEIAEVVEDKISDVDGFQIKGTLNQGYFRATGIVVDGQFY